MAETNKQQNAKTTLAADPTSAKLAQDNARVTAGGTAGTDNPRDTKNPLGEAVAANLKEYNARTAADTAAQAAVGDGAEAVQQGGRSFGEALRHNADSGADV